MIDFYFDKTDLAFRALIVPDKSILDHDRFHQSYDDFYYKMYFDMLKVILDPDCIYNIYLDIKDTRSRDKILKLREVLSNSHYDFSQQIIRKIQHARAHEIELIQLTDLLTGAISYINRDLKTSVVKLKLIERIKKRSHYSLINTTLYREMKMNLFRWSPKERLND